MLTRRAFRLTNVGFKNSKSKLGQDCNVKKARSLHTPVVNSSSATVHAAQPNYYDDESLWVRSSKPDVQTVVGYTIPEIIRENLGGWGHLPAFECATTGKICTHDQVLRDAEGFGAALIKSGFKRGDVVGIVLPNIPEYASVLYGIWNAGLIASPVNAAYSDEEIHRQLTLSDAVCVVAEPETLQAVRNSKEKNPNIKSIIIVDDHAHQGCHTFKEMAKSDPSGVKLFKGKDVDTLNEVALLPFSSGTTGPPKGVELTHSNLTTNLMQCNPLTGTTLIKPYSVDNGQERHLGILPFFHSYGLACLLHMGTYVGAHVMCFRKFDVDLFLHGVRRHKPTSFHLVTPLINHIVNSDNYGKKELEFAHTIMGGAAPIGNQLIEKLLEKAGKYFFFQEGYGMSELSPVSHILLPETRNTKVGSCGSPVPSTVTKIVDPVDGNTLGRNERGEVCVKGPQVMKGYYKNVEATKHTIDADGWLHTGDIGVYDEDGCLYIVDRLKELIKVKGFQVSPAELEDLLRGNLKVEDVAVIGVPHPENGEAPRAYIVPKSNTNLTEDEINAYLKPLVSKHKRLLGGVEFRKSIPKAPSGKILRRELSDEYRLKHGK